MQHPKCYVEMRLGFQFLLVHQVKMCVYEVCGQFCGQKKTDPSTRGAVA
jgi:hypothetical protein